VVEEQCRWDEESYRAIAANGVAWQDASYVLRHGRPRVRRHIGALLHIAAHAPNGSIIGVTLIEESDDQYLVVSARRVEGDEHDAVAKMLSGGRG
jgi:hypothetical protein